MCCSQFHRRLLLLLAVAASTLLTAASAHAQHVLRWKFKEGDAYNYVMDNETERKIDLSGSLIEIKSSMIFDTSWKVKSVDGDGTATIEQTVDRIQMKMDSPLGGGLDYDSQKAGSGQGQIWDMMGPMIESLVGGTFTLKATAAGKVSDITLPEKVKEQLAKQQGGGGGGRRGGGGGMGGMMGGLSEASIKEMITRSVVPLPEKAVSPDITWSQNFEEEMRGAGVKKTAVTYSTSEKSSAEGHEIQKIAAKTEITFEPAEESQVDIEIEEQDGAMTIYFDIDSGRTLKTEGVQKQVIAITAPNREITQEVEEKVIVRQGKSGDGKDAKPADDK